MPKGGVSEFLFGKKVTPEEAVKNWKREIRKEARRLERDIEKIKIEQKKTEKEIKQRLQKGDKGSAKILAKQLVNTRKHVERLYTSKAQLHSVEMQLTSQLAMLKTTKAIAKSTQLIAAMNNLVRVPEMQQTMMAMAREMEKAGIIDEIMEDAFDDPEVDEMADEEIDKVLEEITMGLKTTHAPQNALPAGQEAQTDTNLEDRLSSLKS